MKENSDLLKNYLEEHKVANKKANDENKRRFEKQIEEMNKKIKMFENLLMNRNHVPPSVESIQPLVLSASTPAIHSLQANAEPLQQALHIPAASQVGWPLGPLQQHTAHTAAAQQTEVLPEENLRMIYRYATNRTLVEQTITETDKSSVKRNTNKNKGPKFISARHEAEHVFGIFRRKLGMIFKLLQKKT